VSKPLCKVAIIGENKQTFSLRVQTPNVEETRKFLWKQIKDSIAGVPIFPSRDESCGFVQDDCECGSDVDKFAMDFDVIARVWLCAKVCADLAVDGDMAGGDQSVAMATRTDPSGSKEAIEAQSKLQELKKLNCYKRKTFSLFNFVTLLTNHFGWAHTSGFVFGRPMTLLSFFHCPRFFKSSTRSKRFSTLRLAAMVLAPFKLRCCDMARSGEFLAGKELARYAATRIFQMEDRAPEESQNRYLQLVTKHHIGPRRGELVISVKPIC
jgi:hypothetical protein